MHCFPENTVFSASLVGTLFLSSSKKLTILNSHLQSCGSTLDSYEAATRVTNNWYSEEEEFDYDRNEYTHDSSHFCQLVWKGKLYFMLSFSRVCLYSVLGSKI